MAVGVLETREPLPALQMREKPISDRFVAMEPFVRDCQVMDIGCVDARTRRESSSQRIERKPDLLFQRILSVNPDVLGVDIDPEGVEALQQQGYAVICADGHSMDLGRKFDTIVAGEIIEHLENPGLFLRNMRRHLADDGVLILSTPNPFSNRGVWKIWRYGYPAVHEDHTCWFDPITLIQLLSRCGFRTFDGYWVQPKGKLLKSWRTLFRGYFAHRFVLLAHPEN